MAKRVGKHSAPLNSSSSKGAKAAAGSSKSAKAAASSKAASSKSAKVSHAAAAAPSYQPADSLARARQARKKGRGKKIALVTLAVVLVALLGAGAAVALFLNNIDNTMQDGFTEEQKVDLKDTLAPVDKAEDAYYVALFGSDAREGETVSRSDVTMLVRIDQSAGVVDLISVPRDTMVEIEGQGTQKINAAYAFGGPAGAVKTLSAFAGVPISHYVEVHFDELQTVVDELGGIDVVVPESFYADTSGISLEAGEQTLNGAQALAFARERHATTAGDFSRAQAQRLIVEAVAEKVLEASPTQIPGIVESLARCVTTDYSVSDLVSLALSFKDTGLTMYSAACPSYTYGENGVSYTATMYREWQDMMRRVDAGLDPNDTEAVIPEPQASDESLGAATNGRSPQDYEALAAGALTTDDVIDIDSLKGKSGSGNDE